MKYIGYTTQGTLTEVNFKLNERNAATPILNEVLVDVKAIGLNPIDTKIRKARAGTNEKPVILGWDASGIIKEVGANVKNFKVGDEVFYSGDITKDGSYSQFQLVDSRIIAKKPNTLSFPEAAALPLTSLTAYEMLFEKMKLNADSTKTVLIVGGAGGVGSQAIQLLKTKTKVKIIATASRPESMTWVKDLGADYVVSHNKFNEEIKNLGFNYVDAIFCTTHTDMHLEKIADIIAPFGDFGIIDEPKNFQLSMFKQKAVSIHQELMFTKSLFGYKMESQGDILKEVATYIDTGKLKTTSKLVLNGLTIKNIKKGHEILENHTSIGKIVIVNEF